MLRAIVVVLLILWLIVFGTLWLIGLGTGIIGILIKLFLAVGLALLVITLLTGRRAA